MATIPVRIWDRLGEAQQQRYRRYGITPSYYEIGGSLQRARGHREREHVTRAQRNPQGLTAADYRFLKRQQLRARKSPQEFQGSVRAYKRLSPRQRSHLRERVAKDHREYKRQKSRSGIVRGIGPQGVDASRDAFRSTVFQSAPGGGSGGGDYDEDYEDVGGEDDGYEEINFEEYEDIYPDFDDDLQALMFYH